jgi:tetratricopeptide (TPR) repeat protein
MSFTEGLKEYKAGRYKTAIEYFSKVIEKDDRNHKAWNAMGVCYSSLRMYEDADRCFRNAIAIFPESPVYMNNRMKNRKNIPSHQFAWEEPEEDYPVPETGSHY